MITTGAEQEPGRSAAGGSAWPGCQPGRSAARAAPRAARRRSSEIWSTPAAPIQHAAALAFTEPPQVACRIAASRALHAQVAAAVARVCADAGLIVPPPQAGFYVYPTSSPGATTCDPGTR